MSQQLSGRTQGDLEATHELRRRAKSVPFRDIRGYRGCCPADLVDEAEVLADGRDHRKEIGRPREFLGATPSIEILELPHWVKVGTGGATEGTETAQQGAVCRTHPASRIPHPVLPIPHLASRL